MKIINLKIDAIISMLMQRCFFARPTIVHSSRQSGFTLIELLISITILSILAAIASPLYSEYVQRSKISEALATLGNLSTQMEKNYLDFRIYTSNGDCAVSSPVNENFNYNCESSGQNYTWTATSKNSDYKYSINEKFNKETLVFAGQSGSPANCWIISKNGACF